MTTVPGHNQIMQQSGVAQELSQQAHSPKPSPDQAAALQQAQGVVESTTVQVSDASERLKGEKEKQARRQAKLDSEAERKKKRREDMAFDMDATGRLLDTTA